MKKIIFAVVLSFSSLISQELIAMQRFGRVLRGVASVGGRNGYRAGNQDKLLPAYEVDPSQKEQKPEAFDILDFGDRWMLRLVPVAIVLTGCAFYDHYRVYSHEHAMSIDPDYATLVHRMIVLEMLEKVRVCKDPRDSEKLRLFVETHYESLVRSMGSSREEREKLQAAFLRYEANGGDVGKVITSSSQYSSIKESLWFAGFKDVLNKIDYCVERRVVGNVCE